MGGMGGMSGMGGAGPGQLEGGYDENAAPEESEHGETFQVPLSAFGGKTPEAGSMVSLKVVSVDEKNGMVELAMSTEHEEAQDSMGEGYDHPALRAMDKAIPE